MPNLQLNLFLRKQIATYSSHGVKLQTHLWSQGYFTLHWASVVKYIEILSHKFVAKQRIRYLM